MSSRYPRLSPIDHMMLRTETAAAPTHIGGLCLVEAAALSDQEGAVDLERIKGRLGPRVAAIPELHRIVRAAPPLCGPPLWIDDPDFTIDRHMHAVAVPPPGDETALLESVELLLRPLMDRSRPLWELWVLTGLEGDRVGLLFKIHHALADGLAAVRLIVSLLDDRMVIAAAPQADAPHFGRALPPAGMLFIDNVRHHLMSLGAPLRHPIQNLRSFVPTLAYSLKEMRDWNAAPKSSLNVVAQPGRRLHVLHMDLETARAIAHVHGGKVNDMILAVVTGGIAKLLAKRCENVEGSELVAAIGVNLRNTTTPGDGGNVVGALRLRLPLREPDPERLLDVIAERTRAAKASQHISLQSSNFVLGLVGWLATLGVSFSEHQRMINFFVSNVQGPATPLYALGAEVQDVLPIVGLFGNETVTFVALSYRGHLNLVAVGDRTTFGDIDILGAGMQETWERLASESPPAANENDRSRDQLELGATAVERLAARAT